MGSLMGLVVRELSSVMSSWCELPPMSNLRLPKMSREPVATNSGHDMVLTRWVRVAGLSSSAKWVDRLAVGALHAAEPHCLRGIK